MGKFFKTAQTTKESLISRMLKETGWKSIDSKVVSLIKDKSGTPVGIYTTGVSNKGNPIMGYVYVSPEHRNKGYATKAALEFKKKHPNMEWRAAKDNKTSQHVANKLGLKVIGTENDEYIFKGAAGPVKYIMTSDDMRQNPNLAGKYFSKKTLSANPTMAKMLDPSGKSSSKGLIVTAPKKYFTNGTKYTGEQTKRIVDRHELTHALRDKKGKFNNVGESSIKGIMSTVREEFIAGYKEVPKNFSTNTINRVKGGIAHAKNSTKAAYPGLKLKNILKLIKVGEYAPGIPQKGQKTALPSSQKLSQWDFVVQEHLAERRGRHLDLRLAPPGGVGFSWVVNEIPTPGNRTHAIRTSDHTRDYFDFTGKIKEGYGKGEVKQMFRGKVDVISAKPNKITFYWYGNSGTGLSKFTLIDIYGSDKWILLNHTDTTALKRQSGISPLKYKDMSGGKYVKQEHDFETPKIDGASSVVVLQGGKIPVVYSKRTSKRTGQKIEYTPKIPRLLETRVPKDFGTTVLRAEVFAVGADGKEIPNSTLGGILNASVQKSRAIQQMSGTPLRLAGYDVVKYKGKKTDNLPIKEKYKLIDEISKQFPIIENPLEINQKIPFTEGKIVWRNNVPLKVKDKKDYDVYVRDIFPNIHNTRAGGISYSHSPFGKIVGNVGTGWTHEELKDMLQNPNKYKGRVAKISAQEKYPSGALRAPSFTSWHLDK